MNALALIAGLTCAQVDAERNRLDVLVVLMAMAQGARAAYVDDGAPPVPDFMPERRALDERLRACGLDGDLGRSA